MPCSGSSVKNITFHRITNNTKTCSRFEALPKKVYRASADEHVNNMLHKTTEKLCNYKKHTVSETLQSEEFLNKERSFFKKKISALHRHETH
jgi:hypothetical protein